MPRATKAVMPATISAPASKMIFFMSIGPYRLPAGNSIRLCAKMVKERFAKRPGGSRDDGETVRYCGLSKPALPAVANHHGEGEQTSRERQDRKSVVSGKRVSVRVDLGGRRILKKKQ